MERDGCGPPGVWKSFQNHGRPPRGSASLGWPEEIVSLPADGRKKIFVGRKPKNFFEQEVLFADPYPNWGEEEWIGWGWGEIGCSFAKKKNM